MALRSVLDINVNDAALDRLQQKVEKYQQTARNLPTLGVGGGQRDGQRASIENERAANAAERLSKAWAQMRDHSREVVRNVREMASRFLTITGLMGTLTGAAGLFGALGFNSLAKGASNLRQQSFGEFTTIGGSQAARIGLGRFGDTGAMLSRLGAAAQTPGSEGWKTLQLLRGAAQQAGVQSFDFKAGEDSLSLLEKVAPTFQALMQKVPADRRGMMFEQLKLGNLFGSFTDAQQYIRRSPEELQTQIGRTNAMRSELEVPDNTARTFQDFVSTIERASAVIRTTFINQVAALAGPLGDLSQQVTTLLQSFIKWALSAPNIDMLAAGIQRLGNFLKNEDWAKDWQDFKSALGEAVDVIKGFVDFVKSIGNTITGKTDTPVPLGQQGGTQPSVGGLGRDPVTGKWRFFQGTDDDKLKDAPTDPIMRRQDHWTPGDLFSPAAFHGGRGIPITANVAIPVEIVGFRGFGEKKEEKPEQDTRPFGGMLQNVAFSNPFQAANDDLSEGGLLARIAKVESNFNPSAVSKTGAMGMFQFMPDTWKRFGQGNPFDPIESLKAAQRYLGHLFSLPELGGDPAKVVASYNAGEGRVIAEIKKHGADYQRYLPQETQDYQRKVLGGAPSEKQDFHPPTRDQSKFIIQNEAGGNLVTQTRRMAT